MTNLMAKLTNQIIMTELIKQKIWSCLDIFETGKLGGDYGNISIFNDGPHGIKQLTAGRHQTTETGHLPALIETYIKSDGEYSKDFGEFLPVLHRGHLYENSAFISLFKHAASDPVMQRVQDAFFEKVYWNSAMEWAAENGFTLNLSMLVIYDSFVHSGSILGFLRNRFEEKTPKKGGNEKVWIVAYAGARNSWLKNHSNAILHNTAYRSALFVKIAQKGDWDLKESIKTKGEIIP